MIRRTKAALGCAALLATALLPHRAVAAPPAGHKTYVIVIDKMKFGPAPAGLRPGDTIKWVNRDIFRHTATARDRSFNVNLMPGKSATMTLERAGTLPFYCIFHPGMRGQLVVAR